MKIYVNTRGFKYLKKADSNLLAFLLHPEDNATPNRIDVFFMKKVCFADVSNGLYEREVMLVSKVIKSTKCC